MQDETNLLKQAQTGDQISFENLVWQYGPLTERTARVLLPDRTSAEDAVQETWLDVWRGLPGFRLENPFRPWLLAVLANRCRMISRKRKLVAVPLDSGVAEDWPVTEDVAAFVLRHFEDTDLQTALVKLRPEQQLILKLRFYADLELDEIATLTSVPLGTIKSRLHRALQVLRQEMKQNHEQ